MSFSTTAIKYGWVYLTALGVITGTTIYVANNTRKQVKPEDIIQVVLAIPERCYGTQYGTNVLGEPLYVVDPPSIVRTWTSNVYTTNGVTVYTNIITNTIGWHLDRAMMVEVDTKIKALVPCYADTNTTYEGTTNIVMLTFTGLLTSLNLGDGTNFTRTPAWTNSVSTNWIVSYTNLQGVGWAHTNYLYGPVTTNEEGVVTRIYYSQREFLGGLTNVHICYTTDVEKVVWAVTNISKRYPDSPSSSYTNPAGDLIQYIYYEQPWPNQGYYISNFAQIVQTITNVATYGDYPWQIYVEDLQERYKVLNALKIRVFGDYEGTNFPEVELGITLSGLGSALGGGTCRVYNATLTPDLDLGPADGTVYNTEVGYDSYYYHGAGDQVSLFSSYVWGDPHHGLLIYFGADFYGEGAGRPNYTFQSDLTLNGGANYTRILNCTLNSSSSITNTVVVSNTISSVHVSSVIGGGGSGGTGNTKFNIFAVHDFPFLYCTNKYW